jgi:hypothetical protein
MKIGQSGAPMFLPKQSLESLSLQGFQELKLFMAALLP